MSLLLVNAVIDRASQSAEKQQWSLARGSIWASQNLWSLEFNDVRQQTRFDLEIID